MGFINSIECDQCRTEAPLGMGWKVPRGWLSVEEHTGEDGSIAPDKTFCSWDCLRQYASPLPA